ncbi:odorant receptor 22c isoform X2 [Solenopsis invicta]|uniref:odorant receptor 22c isoform X2 n=1 Tax=Solenopsis invicta TaxID=13686 RepID=UPI00193D5337|nr:odorant receptor 22c isoform X2 [Solenopsis invicta]
MRSTNLLCLQLLFAAVSRHSVCVKFSCKLDKKMLCNEHYKDDMIYVTQLTRNISSLLGIWPVYKRRATSEKVWKYFLICISYALLLWVLIPGALFWLIEKRARVRVRTIPLLFYGIMACSKYGTLIYHETNIRRCLMHIEEDYKTAINEKTRATMLESAKIGRRLVTLCAIFMYGSGLFFRSILPFAKGKIVTAQNITIKPLPCPANFIVFDAQVNSVYKLIFALQILSGLITFSITTGLCGLAAVFVMHSCGQLKILVTLMKNLVEEQWQKEQEVNRKLATLVQHQIRIRNFLQLVENTLQQACLLELFGCTMILCLLGYFIIMEWEDSNLIAMCSYFSTLTSMLINMFIFCYTGEQLTVQAEKVARTSCMLEWYHLPNKEARGIVLVVIMSNLPLKITAGKFMDLSLKTYGDVVKTAVMYFNMLVKVTD